MRYDHRIDDVILKILCSLSKCSYLELKRKVDRIFASERQNRGLTPTISSETFNSHLKSLREREFVSSQEEGAEKSGRVFYSVTKAANCHGYVKMSYSDILVGKTLEESRYDEVERK
jgi:hypothetical protein